MGIGPSGVCASAIEWKFVTGLLLPEATARSSVEKLRTNGPTCNSRSLWPHPAESTIRPYPSANEDFHGHCEDRLERLGPHALPLHAEACRGSAWTGRGPDQRGLWRFSRHP